MSSIEKKGGGVPVAAVPDMAVEEQSQSLGSVETVAAIRHTVDPVGVQEFGQESLARMIRMTCALSAVAGGDDSRSRRELDCYSSSKCKEVGVLEEEDPQLQCLEKSCQARSSSTPPSAVSRAAWPAAPRPAGQQ